ncbi:MAG TPA: glucan biosynthesis protein D [Rhizobacter sp.]|nr:glucan biosynthesis protein D [Rhizobacter sp.]
MQRRKLLGAFGAAAALGRAALVSPAAQAAGLKPLGKPQAFSYAGLKGQARALAGRPYQPSQVKLPAAIGALDFDQYQSIRFRDDHSLWGDEKLRFQVKLFHLGMFFKRPVQIFEVTDNQAQELAYDPAMFDYGKSGLVGSQQPKDLGFAGFRINYHLAPRHDVAAFLGASYFRSTSGSRQYGLSARGLAVDTALPRPEEFPEFVDFYIERPSADASTLVVYALLDSPSITGAYRFAITPGESTLMDIDAALYPRQEIERLGIAPCTSMFQTGENDRRMDNDWRPEIHDSDGLSMYTGSGEWIWRPLNNPKQLRFNSFADNNPRGFGLLQRDRNFDHYQDDGVFYERRPSLWVEPKTGWGAGAIQLTEIPTADETFDNIVAFWNPATKPQPGQEMLFGYRLYWTAEPPARSPLAHVVATRTGVGGIVGQKRPKYSRRFAIDFAGGDLGLIDPKVEVTPVIGLSSGKTEITSARPLASVQGYRAMFDVVPEASTEPITMRVYLTVDGQPLSETWLYEWLPPPLAERKLI